MTDPIYRVRNWSENFENNRTRDLKKMQWVPVPNKHDGDGYTALMDHENGAAHLGAWVALLQVASKCGTRGTLLREGARPHNSRSISRITRVPEPVVQEALTRLSSDEIGWLEVVNTNETKGETPIPQEGAGIPQADVTTVRPSDYGREWTRIEGTKEVRTEPDGSGVLSPDDEPKKPKKSKPTEADRLNANHDDYPNFLDWWKLYPNKTGKQASLAKWIENGCEGTRTCSQQSISTWRYGSRRRHGVILFQNRKGRKPTCTNALGWTTTRTLSQRRPLSRMRYNPACSSQ